MRIRRILILLFAVYNLYSCHGPRDNISLLILKDEGTSQEELQKLKDLGGFDRIGTTEDFRVLASDSVKGYSVVALLVSDYSTIMPDQQTGLQRYMEGDGSLIIIKEKLNKYQWPWLYELFENQERSGRYSGGKFAFLDGDIEKDLEFLIGDNTYKPDQVHTTMAPSEDRFVVRLLDDDLYEPMELEILPDLRVLVMERRGKLKLYDPEKEQTRLIAEFNVCIEGNYEDGLLGMALDPDFKRNNWLYIYYSPPCDNTNQLLSWFKLLGGDSLIWALEKVVLEVAVQRETCCHSGGEVMFDHEGYLWLSTGDNTSSKESDGYTPIDERPGRGPFDAQKSSGNTHDLRGKILRIKVNEDATYSIPDGNLFSKDGSEGRPEIYVMGARNPFRFTVDPKTGYLYWGDVGPDAGESSRYGPESYDEFNQARSPGYYGWPYFMANNIAFPDRDFEADTIGPYFDPENPVNDSPNNTGKKKLPPARPAMIWYPYGESEEFPMLGRGSRSAMGGPFYYRPVQRSEVAFPEYYEGKMFIFEWARSWIKVLHFDKEHNLKKIEPFDIGLEISKPIDLEFGPDGAMYLLEYGANYFADNEDARLVRIEYWEGNKPPVAEIEVDKKIGAIPVTVNLSAEQSYDFDEGQQLKFEWYLGDQRQSFSTDPATSYTLEEAGEYRIRLIVIDEEGAKNEAYVDIKAGNEPPVVNIDYSGNRSFYFDQGTYEYKVSVQDREDGATRDGAIAGDKVNIQFNFLKGGYDLANLGPDAFTGPSVSAIRGQILIEGSDCKSCHDITKKSIGPSYMEIAERYKDQYDAIVFLSEKIKTGGTGNWGTDMMAAHPQHTLDETTEMARYIMSLAEEKGSGLALEGSVVLDQHDPSVNEGMYIFTATYNDQPQNGIGPLTGRDMVVLRNPRIQAENYDFYNKVNQIQPGGESNTFLGGTGNGAYFGFKDIDLNGVRSATLRVLPFSGGEIEIRLGAPEGQLIGSGVVPQGERGSREWKDIEISLNPVQGMNNIYFVIKTDPEARSVGFIDWVLFNK